MLELCYKLTTISDLLKCEMWIRKQNVPSFGHLYSNLNETLLALASPVQLIISTRGSSARRDSTFFAKMQCQNKNQNRRLANGSNFDQVLTVIRRHGPNLSRIPSLSSFWNAASFSTSNMKRALDSRRTTVWTSCGISTPSTQRDFL